MDRDQILFQVAYLENTQLIYDGIHKLGDLYLQAGAQSDGTESFVAETLNSCRYRRPRKSAESTDQTDVQYSPHNSLSHFFQFIEMTPYDSKSDQSRHVAAMLDLYLSFSETGDHAAEQYEKMCDAIRRIMITNPKGTLESGTDPRAMEQEMEKKTMCYLAYSSGQDHWLLTSSRPPVNYTEYITQRTTLDKIMRALRLGRSCSGDLEFTRSKDTVFKLRYLIDSRENTYRAVLALRLPINAEREQYLNLLLEQPVTETESHRSLQITWTDLQICRDIMFLRNKITQKVLKDVGELLAFGKTYRYIYPLDANSEVGKRKIRVIHLSDLHVDAKANMKAIMGQIKDEFQMIQAPDLLVITGDVVQGKGDASQLSENYEAARTVIYEIAKQFWSDGTFMRQDWKRRIIIIPGNHDYASMNELEVVHGAGSRATGLGRPATKEADISVKFSHYIEFLRKGFDVNIDALIADGLNEVRYYEALGICVVCMNTSCASNALRNNKIHLSKQFVESLDYQVPPDAPCCICLAHHTPAYQINYVSDKYWSYSVVNGKQITEEDVKEWVNAFSAYLNKKTVEKLLASQDADETPYQGLEDLLKKMDNKIEMERSEGGEAVARNIEGTELYRDLKYLCKTKAKLTDDRRYQILSDLRRDWAMSEQDSEEYKTVFERAVEKARICAVLGGHIHAIHHEDVKLTDLPEPFFKKIPCFESAKTFSPADKQFIQYSELLWEEEPGGTFVYQFNYIPSPGKQAPRCTEQGTDRYQQPYAIKPYWA